jgi:hypothetical protein
MLSESPSDDTRVQPLSAMRVHFNEASLCNKETDKAIPPTGKTALEAAMAAANTYVETLHKKLQPFLTDLIRQVIVDASHSHFRSEKFKEMNAKPRVRPYNLPNCRNENFRQYLKSLRARALKLSTTNSQRKSRQHVAILGNAICLPCLQT